ncbi:MAG: hypothetical protein LBE04_07510 [Prevotellaceae bacterium]|jgi:hypothetical protein|nr:hypothetical protein [Prevotellaceae bacterium]
MNLLKNEPIQPFFDKLDELECKTKHLKLAKDKLITYLKNSEDFMKKGLIVGSGVMESANMDVIPKKMKLSGQRWSIDGANQIANLRVCYKSDKHDFIVFLIKNFKKAG